MLATDGTGGGCQAAQGNDQSNQREQGQPHASAAESDRSDDIIDRAVDVARTQHQHEVALAARRLQARAEIAHAAADIGTAAAGANRVDEVRRTHFGSDFRAFARAVDISDQDVFGIRQDVGKVIEQRVGSLVLVRLVQQQVPLWTQWRKMKKTTN